MHKQLTLGSLFDGSGGFPLGGLLCGIEPLWASEIEPFPIRVTTKRIPQMKHYGDISKLNGADLPPVDIITFGSPCTDMSVAGKRAGLDGEQSVLFYEAIRIIKEMRRKTGGRYPRYAVWENVPGAFSSNKGADFKAVLDAFVSVLEPTAEVPSPDNGRWSYADIYLGNGWSVAYRTVDAQYFGVPQRRRRIYLVADFAGERAGDILFEREGVSRDFAPCGSPWKGTAGDAENGSGASGNSINSLNDQGSGMNVPLVMNERFMCFGICSDKSNSMLSGNPHSGIYEAKTSRTLDANGGSPVNHQGGIAVVALQGSMIGREDKNGPQGSGFDEDVSFTLNTVDRHAVAYAMTTGSFSQIGENVSPTLMSRDYKDPPVVGQPAYGIDRAAYNQGRNAQHKPAIEEEQQPTLTAKDPGAVAQPASFYPQMKAESQCFRRDGKANTLVNGTCPGYQNGLIEPDYIVRRLTPTECARLQGFPDYWCSNLGTDNPSEEEIAFWTEVWETHRRISSISSKPKTRKQIIKWLHEPHSDSAEYAMWGNGVSLPTVIMVMQGIVSFEQ